MYAAITAATPTKMIVKEGIVGGMCVEFELARKMNP